jgi:hypothetical protein
MGHLGGAQVGFFYNFAIFFLAPGPLSLLGWQIFKIKLQKSILEIKVLIKADIMDILALFTV